MPGRQPFPRTSAAQHVAGRRRAVDGGVLERGRASDGEESAGDDDAGLDGLGGLAGNPDSEPIIGVVDGKGDLVFRVLIGEPDRIVGITGCAVHPPEARREKPKVSAFTSAKIDTILVLKPDLVLTFSDLQADIAAELIRHGIEVHAFNQRNVEGILAMIRTLGALVGATDRAECLLEKLRARLDGARRRAGHLHRRPRVFFEEWDEPLISGIGWVSELIGIAGGDDIFPERSTARSAKERIVTPEQVVERRPDILTGSWCGKRFVPAKVRKRPGFADIPAVASGELHEITSTIILQPGPAALTDGLDALLAIVDGWSRRAPQGGIPER